MKQSSRDGVFHCYFTELPLTDVYPHPLYATWEHREPGDESSVVVAADFVNKMKGNLDEDGFRETVIALARTFKDGEAFDSAAIAGLLSRYEDPDSPPPSRFVWQAEDVIFICPTCSAPEGSESDCTDPFHSTYPSRR